MDKRNESTLKVIQHEMYHAGKMQLKTNSTEFMGIFCMAAVCLFTSVAFSGLSLVLRCPGPMPEHPLKLLEHTLLSAVFSNKRSNCTCTNICVLLHGASENKEAHV